VIESNTKRKKEFPLNKMLKYMNAKQWVMAFAALVFIVLQVWLDLELPDYMSEITTLVETEGSSMTDILHQGEMMLLCALGSMASSVIVGYFAAKVAAGLAKTLRNLVYTKTISFGMEQVRRFSSASLINRTTNDITQIQTLVAMGLQAIIKAPILAVWACFKIAGKSWQWTTATAVASGLVILMLGFTLIFAVPRFRKVQGLTDKINLVLQEHLTGIRVVRAYNAENYQQRKFSLANSELTQTNLVANRVMAIMSPGMTFTNSGLTLAVYWIGAYLIDSAALNLRLGIFSDMVVFTNYAMQIIMAFTLLVMIFILLPRAQVAANRISEVLETENTIVDGNETNSTPNQKGEIEFRNVSFRYPEAAAEALSDINFTVHSGETLAFIGATGCGKSTLINLVPRFYDATEGEVLVDGVNVKNYKQSALHDKIGYVSQKAILFSGTVESNIRYGKKQDENISDADIEQAAEISQSQEFIQKMDNGLNSRIAQGGTNVSGGQKQRLAIARALARKPEILIFDDSFSALDYKTDRNLRKALDESYPETTKLIVAQRIGTIRNADQIIVLDHGKAVGRGTHEELLKNCPEYLEIAQSQLSESELRK
jgi:ATP-binding cassette subfamily B multidrug efflux pump